MRPKAKWKFAIGTTSRVPDSGGMHYVIMDIDSQVWPNGLVPILELADRVLIQRTEHGWHFYTDLIVPWGHLPKLLREAGADPAWVTIGEERGYYFLADKSALMFSWKVEHMVIYYGKEKARNT